MSVASPCTGICKLDAVTGWCLGCARSGEEMNGWASRPEPFRQAIWDLIPERMQQMGVTCRRLPWSTQELRAFVVGSFEKGTWVMGVQGALAEFSVPPGGAPEVRCQGDDVICQTRGGALRMQINDDVRALTFDPPGLARAPRVVLAVTRERGRLPVSPGVTELGDDAGALITEPGTRLYDLGLGRKEARFSVRLGQGAAQRAVQAASGLPMSDALPHIGRALLAESPTRVVQTALGRVEVQGAIPLRGAVPPDGPHSHLLPDQLATGRALPAGMELPRAYLPGAVFYPVGEAP